MEKQDTGIAQSDLQEQIRKLSSMLDEVLEARRANEATSTEHRSHLSKLRQEASDIAAEEGRLRGEIARLETVLKSLKR